MLIANAFMLTDVLFKKWTNDHYKIICCLAMLDVLTINKFLFC